MPADRGGSTTAGSVHALTRRERAVRLVPAVGQVFLAYALSVRGHRAAVDVPGLYHGKVADNIADAEALGNALDTNHLQAKADIVEATLFLNERVGQAAVGLAVIGFSLGAYYALDLAAAEPEHIRSVVLFYGTGADDFSNSRAAYLGRFAENDEFEPKSNVDELEESLRRAGRPVTFYRYSGTGHWFFEPDRSDAYNRDAATLAWERTLTFLRSTEKSKAWNSARSRLV